MDWSKGPLSGLLGRGDSQSKRPAWVTGAAMGAAAGPAGMAIGALGGWLSSRGWFGGGTVDGPIAGQGTLNAIQDRQNDATARSIFGGPDAGPDASAPDDGSAWYEDGTMGADDELGLVPDYGQDGPAGGMTPQEHRAGLLDKLSNKGNVSNFMVGGSPVIMGTGDPNQRYRQRRTAGN